MTDNQIYWYAARTFHREREIAERLRRMGIEHFIPFHTVHREQNGVVRKREEPVIPNLVFIRCAPSTGAALTRDLGFRMNYIKHRNTFTPVTIPDKQMDDFIFLLNYSDTAGEIIEGEIKQGDRVRVIKGDFAGIEGELVRIKKHKRVIIKLYDTISFAMVFIPLGYLQKIESPAQD